MLAMGIERDVADQHELIVLADLGEGAVEQLGRAFAIAAIELAIGVDDTPGRLDQAFALRTIAGKGDQGTHRGFRLLTRGACRGWLRGSPHMIGKGRLVGYRLRPRFDDSVHYGLSVRPVPPCRGPGVSPARPHRSYAPL